LDLHVLKIKAKIEEIKKDYKHGKQIVVFSNSDFSLHLDSFVKIPLPLSSFPLPAAKILPQ
jgi:hypothetical protein